MRADCTKDSNETRHVLAMLEEWKLFIFYEGDLTEVSYVLVVRYEMEEKFHPYTTW